MCLTIAQQNEAFRKALTIYLNQLVFHDIETIEAILIHLANLYGNQVEINEVDTEDADTDTEDDSDFVEIGDEEFEEDPR